VGTANRLLKRTANWQYGFKKLRKGGHLHISVENLVLFEDLANAPIGAWARARVGSSQYAADDHRHAYRCSHGRTSFHRLLRVAGDPLRYASVPLAIID